MKGFAGWTAAGVQVKRAASLDTVKDVIPE
jgi:hypothetical protein